MRPGALGEQAGQFIGFSRGMALTEKSPHTFPDLANGLFGLIGQDKRLVVNFRHRLLRYGFEHSYGGILADLRIHGSQHRVSAHNDLICSQGDQCSTRHGVVGNKYGDLGFMVAQRPGDLQCGQH